MYNTASELHNDLLEIYYDEWYEFFSIRLIYTKTILIQKVY